MLALVILLAAEGQPAGLGEPTASLTTFLDAGEKMNVDRRISVEQVERAAAEYQQAWLGLLPAVTVQGSWQHNQYEVAFTLPDTDPVTGLPTGTSRELVITPKNQLNGSVRIDVPLIDVGRWLRVSASSAANAASRERDKLSQDVMRRTVLSSYYGYVAALAVRESARKTLNVSQELLKLAEVRQRVGTAVELDVLRARAEVERAHQSIADSEALVNTSARTLRTLTGVEPPKHIGLGADDLRPEPGYEELEPAIEKLPSVTSADADFTAARRLKIASYFALLPTIGGQFTEQLTNATGFLGRYNQYNFGLVLNWRLDGIAFGVMRQQQALAATAELSAEKSRLNARDQLYGDWQRFTAARTKVTAAAAQVEAATRASSIANTRYNLGAATQLDTIQAARDAFFAEVTQIQARTDLAVARASLRISSGRALE